MRRLASIAAAVMTAGTALAWAPPAVDAGAPLGATPAPVVRKNVLELTNRERRAFVRAVHLLKHTPSPYDATLNYYDQFVEWHRTLYRCNGVDFPPTVGHGGSFFLPWHRVFVRLFEQALTGVSGRPIAVPYWDWTSKESTDSVFRDDFMGGDGNANERYAVTTGPFRKGMWEVTLRPENHPWITSYRPYLVRKFGSGQSPVPGGGALFLLPPVTDVQWALSASAYDAAPFDTSADPNVSFRNAIEGWWRASPNGTRYADPVDHQHCGPDGTAQVTRDGGNLHNRVHTYTGGTAVDPVNGTAFGTMTLPTSPADPVFFLNHANIDRLWAKWQAAHPHATFAPATLATSVIEPFFSAGKTFTPASTWNIGDLGYAYSDFVDSDDAAGAPSVDAATANAPRAAPTVYTCERTNDQPADTVGRFQMCRNCWTATPSSRGWLRFSARRGWAKAALR